MADLEDLDPEIEMRNKQLRIANHCDNPACAPAINNDLAKSVQAARNLLSWNNVNEYAKGVIAFIIDTVDLELGSGVMTDTELFDYVCHLIWPTNKPNPFLPKQRFTSTLVWTSSDDDSGYELSLVDNVNNPDGEFLSIFHRATVLQPLDGAAAEDKRERMRKLAVLLNERYDPSHT